MVTWGGLSFPASPLPHTGADSETHQPHSLRRHEQERKAVAPPCGGSRRPWESRIHPQADGSPGPRGQDVPSFSGASLGETMLVESGPLLAITL